MENTVQQARLTAPEPSVGFVQRMLICGYFLLSFFEPYLNGVLGALTKYYILMLMGVLCLRHRRLRIRSFHWCFIGWLIYKIISILWTTNSTIPQMHMFSQIGMVGLLFVLTAIPLDRKTIDSIVNTMWIGSAAIGVLSLFLSHPYHGIVLTRQVLYLFGQEADPNNQAAFLLVGLTISLYNIIALKQHRIFSFATIVVNAYSLFMTGSRGGLVGLVCVGLVLLMTSAGMKGIGNKIKLLLAAAVIGIVFYYIANKFLPKDIFARLFEVSSYEGGSERDIIWRNGWELLSSGLNFVFGAGWGAYFGYNGYYMAMHNTFLAMLCDVGILGCVLFFAPTFRTCWQMLRKKNYRSILLIICGFIPSFFIDAINKRIFWNVIFYLFIVSVNLVQEGIDDEY